MYLKLFARLATVYLVPVIKRMAVVCIAVFNGGRAATAQTVFSTRGTHGTLTYGNLTVTVTNPFHQRSLITNSNIPFSYCPSNVRERGRKY